MIKKIFILIYFVILQTNLLFAEEIKKFVINGNKRITDETIIVFSNINIGSQVNSDDLNDITKKLYETNFFYDIELSLNQGILQIKVVENAIIQTVVFNGVKNKRILSALEENILLKEKRSFFETYIKDDEEKITNILRTNGYYFAKVDSKYLKNDNNTIDLIYDIELGERSLIKKIKFIGNKVLKDRKLKEIIVSEEARFWKIISKKKYLDIKRIELDKNLLKNYYKNNGYYNVAIESSSAQLVNDEYFELIFNINAGEKYYFRNATLELPQNYSQENFNGIISIFDKLKNKIYSLKKIEEILKEIDNIALSKQFEFISAQYNEKIIGKNKIDLNIKINESEKIYVNRIKVFGNYTTQENVIRNAMLVDEGDPFNEILLNNSINELKYKNIFNKVSFKLENTSDNLKKNIIINVQEKPTGEISAGAGTGTSGTQLSFGIAEKNYGGAGVRLDTNFHISDTFIRGKFSINNPNYNNSDKSLNTTIESTNIDQMSNFGYETTRTGLSLGTSYEQFKDIYFSPSFSNYYENLKTSSTASTSKKSQKGSYFDSEFNYRLSLNKLNQNFQPTDGYKTSFYQNVPLYSKDYALDTALEYSKFFSPSDSVVFNFSIFARGIASLNGKDVRVSKRVFLPNKKLRGFKSGRIGPLDSGEYIGGNYGSALNFVSSFPNLLPELQNVDFSIFVDAGNVWGVDYNESLDKSKIRSSTGVAINWFTPIGPLNFSLAVPISKADTDKTETFRFDIGTTF
jgi:outer membrane protein insertion porin family|tara:strand:- start:561 stop:2798 length:2238 start_codon:yes stop_codon:yes gene_type:complete